MNTTEYLLAHLQEECSEVIKAAAKAQRFGLADTNPKTGNLNRDEIREECGDILNLIDHLVEIEAIEPIDHEAREAKKAKGLRMMEYSRERGALIDCDYPVEPGKL